MLDNKRFVLSHITPFIEDQTEYWSLTIYWSIGELDYEDITSYDDIDEAFKVAYTFMSTDVLT